MERTVPTTESEEIELYTRTYFSLLRSTAEVQIRTLEEVHAAMGSLLHAGARDPRPDTSAFIYTLLRLPVAAAQTQLVVLGQSAEVFARDGWGDVFAWEEVSAPARRRRCFFDGQATLACFIASRSDIDDIIPLLTGFQIEWNKLHTRLARLAPDDLLTQAADRGGELADLAEALDISTEDLDRLAAIWQDELGPRLAEIAARPLNLRVKLLSGSLSEYRRATHAWWNAVEEVAPELRDRPVYFVSSNTHSLLNLLSGTPLQAEARLLRFLDLSGSRGLLNEWKAIQAGETPGGAENFLYYVYKKYLQSAAGRAEAAENLRQQAEMGIWRIPARRFLDVEVQVFELARLDPRRLDPRLGAAAAVGRSDALILNVDYPLGLSAYNILSEVADHVRQVLGVYVIGKAATLNGVVGDVMIPTVVHDEQTRNTYIFPNSLTAAGVAPFLKLGTVLDNQKAVTVQGTFLQNGRYMDVFYREGYTDIEMEAGPYLSAVYELYRPTRHPTNEIVNLYGLPFDLGVVHYASDTPLSKGKNLGAGSLSYAGMDPTYATSVAVLRRIFQLEAAHLEG
jgi:hypothetical protein